MTEIRILIVEDEPPIARNLQQILTTKGYTVVGIAYDPAEAFDKLAAGTADLVLLDINLNGQFTGLDIGASIRDRYGLPFIFITSYADPDTLARAKVYQPVGYIVKPFTEDEIYAAIEVGWYNAGQERKDHIDIHELNARLADPLTPTEFKVLLDLIKGLPYKEIADKHYVSLNTVNSHIKKIYAKFGLHTRGALTEYLRTLL